MLLNIGIAKFPSHKPKSGQRTVKCALMICAVVALCLAAYDAGAQDYAKITDVQARPDLKGITVKIQGPVGKHSAFVIERPYRLVLDIESTGLGNLPGKVQVGKAGIKEIRVGSVNQKGRVVVDFGDNPVPPFSIDRTTDSLNISLGSVSESPLPRAAAESSRLKSQVHAKQAGPQVVERKGKSFSRLLLGRNSRLLVRSAGVEDNLVYVELGEIGNPASSCRLVIDYDKKNQEISGASVSDSHGLLKKFQLVSGDMEAVRMTRTKAGPRKQLEAQGDRNVPSRKFKWGLQSSKAPENSVPKMSSKSPLKMEEFDLKKREMITRQ